MALSQYHYRQNKLKWLKSCSNFDEKPFIIPTPYWLTFYYSYPLLAHQATDENV